MNDPSNCVFCTNEKNLVFARSKREGKVEVVLCIECHRALWYAFAGDEEKIYDECLYYQKQRYKNKGVVKTKDICLEIEDKVRKNKSPITYEEIADLSWELHYNKASKIYDYLSTKD